MDQICRIWPLLKAHWKCSGFMFIDTASSRLTCEEAAHTARWLWACHWPTSTDAKKMQKEQTSRSQIEISSILYRMFNRSFDGKGVITRIAWSSLVSSWNSNEFCASACSDSPSCAACEALVSNKHDRILTTGMFVYLRERLVSLSALSK